MTVVGSGNYKYQVVDNWAQLPKDWTLGEVSGVAVDSQDRVYVFNRSEHPLLIFNRDGTFFASWAEDIFSHPHGITVGPDDSVYCTDMGDHTVRKLGRDGQLLMTLGVPGQPSDTGAQGRDYRTVQRSAPPFNSPTDVAISPSGDIFVSDGYGNARIHRFAPDGELTLSWGEPGSEPGQFMIAHGVALSQDGNVYVADRENNRIQVFTYDGKHITHWGDVNRPNRVHIDGKGDVYVTELGYRVGRRFGLPTPTDESPWSRLSIFDLDGNLLARWGDADHTTPGSFYAAHGAATDSRGDLYVGEVSLSVSLGNPPAGYHLLQKFARVG